MTDITDSAEWKALAGHHAELQDRTLRDLFAADPGRGERLRVTAGRLYLDYSKNRVTDETLDLLLALADAGRAGASASTRCSRGEHINVTEDRAVLHTALRLPRRRVDSWSTAQDVVADVHAVLDRWRRSPTGSARASGRAHRQADPHRGQHRHRRLRPRTRDGLRGAAATTRRGLDVPVRVEHRRRRLRRGASAASTPQTTLFIVASKTFTHARDADQRHGGPRMARRRRWRRRGARWPSTSSRSSTNAEKVAGVRHRHRQHVRLLGLGRRALLALARPSACR